MPLRRVQSALCAVLCLGGALGLAGAAQAGDGPVDEARAGLMYHDPGIYASAKEEGLALNLELVFDDWTGWEEGWAIRPHLGTYINLNGDTSALYAGLGLRVPLGGTFFYEATLGAAVHDGQLNSGPPDRKELGCSVLIHSSSNVGVDVADNLSLNLYHSHMSNGGACEANEGLDEIGLRFGTRF